MLAFRVLHSSHPFFKTRRGDLSSLDNGLTIFLELQLHMSPPSFSRAEKEPVLSFADGFTRRVSGMLARLANRCRA